MSGETSKKISARYVGEGKLLHSARFEGMDRSIFIEVLRFPSRQTEQSQKWNAYRTLFV